MRKRQLVTVLAAGGPSDTTAPTVTITCAQTGPTVTTPLNMTFTFSEAVTGFAVGDITAAISGGTVTKSNFAGSGTTYTCDLAPSVSGTMTVDVGAGVCVDGAGNGNTAATQFTISVIVLALQVEFATDDAAPVSDPYNGEIGALAAVDTATSYLSVGSGKVTGTRRTTSYFDPRLRGPSFSRAIGYCVSAKISAADAAGGSPMFGISNGTTPVDNSTMEYVLLNPLAATPTLRNQNTAESINLLHSSTLSDSTFYRYYFVLRSAGVFLILNNGTSHILVRVDKSLSAATLYAVLGAPFADNKVWDFDSLRAAQLGGPWVTSDYGIADSYTASPATGATATMSANGIVEVTWTASTGVTAELDVRRTDDDNRWIVRCDQGGSTIKLIERNASTETERSSAAQTWTNGTTYRIEATCHGNTIETAVGAGTAFNAVAKNSYTSASFNNTATGVKVTASAGTLANLTAYPRVLSGTALSWLTAMVA